jgi:hypothetical protein
MNKLFDLNELKEIDGVSSFIAEMEGKRGPIYFRGIANREHKLVPTVGREYSFGGKKLKFSPEQERLMFDQFRRYTYPFVSRVLTEWEAILIGRHHGLPVRLLDWTSNPLVALYFACAFENDLSSVKCGIVYFFHRDENNKDKYLHVSNMKKVAPFDVKGVRLVFPFYPTPRMTAQSGIFTIHEKPELDLREIEKDIYEEADCDIESGGAYVIQKDKKPGILRQLERLGVNHRTLMVDLDGIAKGIWHSQVIRD